MKNRWREYEQAGIIGIRGLQQAGAYTFYFRKGIVDYDPRAMERVVTRGAAPRGRRVVTNHYSHLTDPEDAARWRHIYAGRVVRIYPRATDLRIEILGPAGTSRAIRLYVFMLLDTLLYSPSALKKGLFRRGRRGGTPTCGASGTRPQPL